MERQRVDDERLRRRRALRTKHPFWSDSDDDDDEERVVYVMPPGRRKRRGLMFQPYNAASASASTSASASASSPSRTVKQEEAVLQQWTAIAGSPDRRASTAAVLAKVQSQVQSGKALSGFVYAEALSRKSAGRQSAGPEESSDGEEQEPEAEEERRRREEEERESRAQRRASIRPRLVRQLIDQIDGSDSDG